MVEEYNHGKEFPALKPGLRFPRRADHRETSECTAAGTRRCVHVLECREGYLLSVVFIHREVRGQVLERRGVRVSLRDTSAGLDSSNETYTFSQKPRSHQLTSQSDPPITAGLSRPHGSRSQSRPLVVLQFHSLIQTDEAQTNFSLDMELQCSQRFFFCGFQVRGSGPRR